MNANHEGWLAGSAVMPFPIEAGTPMAGYAARTGHSNGTLDPLTVSALALSVQGRELVIVSADVVAVDAAVTQKVAAAAGIARSSLLIAASHTHSGPAGISTRLHPASAEQVDHDLRRRFVAASAETIALAREGRLPATVSIGQAATTGLASNRNDPAGPYDPGLTVLTVQRESGAFDAVLVQWACHPTTLGAGNARISADFPGTLRSHLRGQLAPGDPVVVISTARQAISALASLALSKLRMWWTGSAPPWRTPPGRRWQMLIRYRRTSIMHRQQCSLQVGVRMRFRRRSQGSTRHQYPDTHPPRQ